ncbi:hypothetical protein [Methanobacterium sp. A39]|uniref:hypothetical protein n=1 Tax=Methanobacterium sp. A39 TaxID=1860100 RepID=UPI00210176A6|nr:hypothetical protein [Methanobacterium sp. A39]
MVNIRDSPSFTVKNDLTAGNTGPTMPISRAPLNTPTKSRAKILFLCLHDTSCIYLLKYF